MFLCSMSRLSHMEATIFETSPKLAFGFCPLMAAWVSRKKRAYADTGFCGSFGSLFFFFFCTFGFLMDFPPLGGLSFGSGDGRLMPPINCERCPLSSLSSLVSNPGDVWFEPGGELPTDPGLGTLGAPSCKAKIEEGGRS